jgi:hypothetical protein
VELVEGGTMSGQLATLNVQMTSVGHAARLEDASMDQ